MSLRRIHALSTARPLALALVASAALAGLASCAAPEEDDAQSSYEAELRKLSPTEQAQIGELVAANERLQNAVQAEEKKTSLVAPRRRAVHTKSTGCASGVLEVRRDLDTRMRAGVFQPGARYPVRARFSNGAPHFKADHETSSRGFAIKLLDVERVLGERGIAADFILPERAAQGQDFTFLNKPVFLTRNLDAYVRFTHNVARSPLAAFLSWFHPGDGWDPGAAFRLKDIVSMPIEDPTTIPYFGQLPYRLGKTLEVKYRLDPCAGAPKQDKLDANSPREALYLATKARMERGEACFVFSVIERKDADAQPLEDPTVEWLSDDDDIRAGRRFANRTEVARIVFPKQTIPAAQAPECETLSYNPADSLEEHAPLGLMGAARVAVYTAGGKLRPNTSKPPVVDAALATMVKTARVYP